MLGQAAAGQAAAAARLPLELPPATIVPEEARASGEAGFGAGVAQAASMAACDTGVPAMLPVQLLEVDALPLPVPGVPPGATPAAASSAVSACSVASSEDRTNLGGSGWAGGDGGGGARGVNAPAPASEPAVPMRCCSR